MRRLLALSLIAGTILVASSAAAQKRWRPRRPGEIFGGVGVGQAFCNTDDPANNCATNVALTFSLGGGFRFHRHFSFGLELGWWDYTSPHWHAAPNPNDVSFSSHYVAPYFRWYWFGRGHVDGYLHFGAGYGWVTAHSNGFDRDVNGMVFPLGLGVEWYLGTHFRLGPQFLFYVQRSFRTCDTNGGVEVCRDAGVHENALPWRLMLMGTIAFGR